MLRYGAEHPCRIAREFAALDCDGRRLRLERQDSWVNFDPIRVDCVGAPSAFCEDALRLRGRQGRSAPLRGAAHGRHP
jgi:hypothetical protein